MAAMWVVIAALDLASQQSRVVVGFRFFVAVWFAGMGALQLWCNRRGPREKRLFQWTAVASTVLILLVVVVLLL